MSKKRKEKYKQMPPEVKKKLVEYNKQWFNRETPEKQLELQEKARKDMIIYDNMLVRVRY